MKLSFPLFKSQRILRFQNARSYIWHPEPGLALPKKRPQWPPCALQAHPHRALAGRRAWLWLDHMEDPMCVASNCQSLTVKLILCNRYRDRLGCVHAADFAVCIGRERLYQDGGRYWSLGVSSGACLHLHGTLLYHGQGHEYSSGAANICCAVYGYVGSGDALLLESQSQ